MGRKIILNGKEYIGGGEDVSGIVDSLNTTEQTPRNIADVLAEELKGIADNILPPNASQIAYDNTASGLTATNVQDAIDEVISSQADVIADTMADLTENKTAVVTDGVADFETIDGSLVKSLVVEIEPSQSGTGTPSPDNIRPIIPWTQEDVLIVGENIFDGVYPSLATAIKYKPIFVGDGEYTLKTTAPRYNDSGCAVFFMAGSTSSGANNDDHGAYNGHPRTQTAIDGYVTIAYRTIGGISPADYVSTIGKSKTYTTPFNQTVYGGTLDVVSGELTVDSAFIASYNGETLPSTWISDRDVYAVGTTPTTGAEVCYKLATPQTIQLSPTMVKALVGENHISASTGDVLECKFSMLINGDDLEMLLS